MHTGFGGLHWVVLIVHWRGWTGQVVDAINLNVKRECDVMSHQFKARMIQQVLHIALASREKIVDAEHVNAVLDQSIAQVGAKEA